MRATGARGTRNTLAAVLLIVAAACLTATVVFGQSQGRRQKNAFDRDAMSQVNPVLGLGSLSALNQQTSVSLALGGRDAGAVFFLKPSRAGTINNRVGSLSAGQLKPLGSGSAGSGRSAGPDATSDTFTNGAGTGLWSNAGNWSAGLPGTGNDVLITGSGSAANVTEDINASINNLTLGSADTLTTNTNIQLSISGTTITNPGKIVINGGSATNSFLLLDNSVTLSGAGTLTLSTVTSGGGNTFLEDGVSGITLTNSSIIQGEGIVGNGGAMGLTNSGTVNANSTGGTLNTVLELDPAGIGGGAPGITNTGLLEATNSGVLDIQSTTVNNSGGNITAKGSTATVELASATVQGGTLNTTTGGTLETPGGFSATLDGTTHGAVTLSTGSTYSSALNSQTTVLGTINNNGTILLNGGAATNTDLFLSANTTLQGTGGGKVTLSTTTSGGGNTFIQDSVAGVTLTNVNNIIQGEGIIGNGGAMALVNQTGGTINANSTGSLLNTVLEVNPANGVTNTGLMEATNSGVLDIQSTTVNNAGGNIMSNGASSTVELVAATIQGGTLTNTSGFLGTPQNNVATLDGSSGAGAITLKGTYTSDLNTQTTLLGTINNDNNLQLNGGVGTNTFLFIGANTTLQGSGTVTLSTTTSGGGNTFIQDSVANTTLTNVNNTIQGEGVIGNGGAMALVNQTGGTINANSAGGTLNSTLEINPANGVTNTGLMESSNSGVLDIQSTTVNNASGHITSNGGTVEFVAATIQGGTLTNNSGFLGTPQSNVATLDGSSAPGAITLKGTYTSDFSSQTTLLGTINNDNNLQVNGGSAFNTFLLIGSNAAPNVTLQGGGTVTLSTTASGGGNIFIEQAVGGVTLTNVNNTIQGEGIIGNNGLALINQSGGTIDANSAGSPLISTLTIDGLTGSLVNQGLLEATNSGVLQIDGITVNNTGGNITANGAAATVQLFGAASVQGGTLTNNGGTLGTPAANNATLDGSTTAGAVTLKGTYLSDLSSQTTLLGTINNDNNFQLNGGSSANSFLLIGGGAGSNTAVTLQGGGTVTLSTTASGGGNAFIEQSIGGVTLTNVNNTIQGEGIIGNNSLNLVNQSGGTIDANSMGSPLISTLTFQGGSVTNQGLIEATNSGVLQISGETVNNAGGTITNGSSTATVQFLSGANVQGGTLTNNGGFFGTPQNNTATLDGTTNGALTLNGTYTSDLNTQTTLVGTFNNNGNLQLNGGSATNSFLLLSGNTTLQGNGHGTLTLNNTVSGGGNTFLQASVASTLTNTNNTIQGAGVIGNGTGLTIVNSAAGTILANSPGQTLLLNGAGSVTNNGTLEVTAGGTGTGTTTLQVTSPFTNFAGNTLTGGTYIVNGINAQATLQINALGTTGGEIVNNAAKITLNGVTSNIVDQNGLDALTNLASNSTTTSAFTIEGGRNFTTVGNFTNNGTLTVGSGSTFAVPTGFSLTNFSGTTLNGGTYNVTGTLQFPGANIVTNKASITLTGTSAKIINSTGGNGLANFATNFSGAHFTINSGANFTTVGNFTNSGTLTVGSSNSKFDVNGNLTNFSGTTLTGGTYAITGTLQFNGANIVTNAANITLTGASAKIIDQNSNNALAGLASNTSAGKLTLASSQVLSDSATAFTNAGTLTIKSGSKLNLSSATATYTQSAGTTTVDGTLTAKGGITISGGSVFGKSGTLSALTGGVTNSGTVNIGDTLMTAAKETVSGTYTQTSTGVLNIDIGGTTAGTNFDQFVITSTATLGGTLNLDLINGFVPTLTETFDILNASSVVGTFATVNTPTFNGGTLEFAVMYNSNNVTLDVVTVPRSPSSPSSGGGLLAANLPHSNPTPEPGSLLLLGSGLLGVAGYARRRATSRKRV